jgi:hypothetical protein
MGSDPRDALAVVCAQFDDLRTIASRYGEESRLESVLTRIRDHVPDALAELDELLRRCGVPGGTGRQVGGLPPAGPGHPVEEAYVCPLRRCARVELPATGKTAAPSCALDQRALQLIRL